VAFVDLSDATLVPYTPPPPEAPRPGLIDQIPPAEYAALVDFYTSLQGPWYESDGWSDPTASSWNGVTVSGFDYDHRTGEVLSVGHVTELNLYSRGLSGPLPESLGNLTYLQVLNTP
jgi:hypothetical protein